MSSENKCEPVAYQFQDRDGVWRPFVDQRHYENTLKDGTWPIRPLYSTRGPDAVLVSSKKLTEMQARIAELERVQAALVPSADCLFSHLSIQGDHP